jgi:hypothetical protein
VEIQEQIEENLEEAEKKFAKLKKLQMSRVKNFKFSDDDDYQTKQQALEIANVSNDVTALIRMSDTKLKQLVDFNAEDNKTDKVIRQNIQSNLASKLKDLTGMVRRQEKEHYLQV